MKPLRDMGMALFTVLMCVNFASCSSDDEFENGLPVKNNAIYYTTTDGIIIRLKKDDVFGGASIVSNTYSTTKGYGTIEFSSEVTAIEYCAFIDCSTLKKITLPNSIITIENSIFSGCENLESITIPKKVSQIGSYLFDNCEKLTSIKVDNNNAKYDSRYDCSAIIETNTNKIIAGCKNTIIPNDIKTIGKGAFRRCLGLESIIIPNNVITIESQAFLACKNLKDIELSKELITIDDKAFKYCTSLSSITFPKNVKEIGYESFYDCRNLISITCYGIVAPEFAPDAFHETPYGKGTLYYPKGSDYSKWLNLFSDWKHQEIDI